MSDIPEAPDFMESAEEATGAPSGTELTALAGLARQLQMAQAEVDAYEQDLASAKANLAQIAEVDIPTAMKAIGIKTITLLDGSVLTVEEKVEASISEERRPLAHKWLKDNKYGGIIKTVVAVAFGRGEEQQARLAVVALRETLKREDIGIEERVHPQTLLAFIRERLRAEKLPPVDTFGIRTFDKAKLTPPPKRK